MSLYVADITEGCDGGDDEKKQEEKYKGIQRCDEVMNVST